MTLTVFDLDETKLAKEKEKIDHKMIREAVMPIDRA